MAKIELKSVAAKYHTLTKKPGFSLAGGSFKSVLALQDITFSLSDYDRLGVIGSNGSGKSTLLKLLAGVVPISSGALNISGERLALLDRTAGVIHRASLHDNAVIKAYSLGLDRSSALEFAEQSVVLADLEKYREHSFSSLSTGMAGRFNMAINSLVVKEITIMDEWVGTLDTGHTGDGSLLDDMISNTKIFVLASHNQSLIRNLCNKIVLLNNSKLEYFGEDLDEAFERMDELDLEKMQFQAELKAQAQFELDVKTTTDINYSPNSGELEFEVASIDQSNLDKTEKDGEVEQDKKKGASEIEETTPVALEDVCREAPIAQPLVVPKILIHVLNLGRTSLPHLRPQLEGLDDAKFEFKFHYLQTRLKDIPADEYVWLIYRDPIERFLSAFYSRKEQGRPFYFEPWSGYERDLFMRYKTPSLLAEALSAEHSEVRFDAAQQLLRINFMAQGYGYHFQTINKIEVRKKYIVGSDNISDKGSFLNCLNKLSEHLNFDLDDPDESRIEKQDLKLSAVALENLKNWFSDEYTYFNYMQGLENLSIERIGEAVREANERRVNSLD